MKQKKNIYNERSEAAATRFRRFRIDHRRDYAAIGPPPPDALEATAWAHRVLSVGMFHVANDSEADEAVRRKELRETARVMAALVPQNRILSAERLIKGDMKRMEDSEGNEVEDAPQRDRRPHRPAPAGE